MEVKASLWSKRNFHLLPFIGAELFRPFGGPEHDAVHPAVSNEVKLGDGPVGGHDLRNLLQELALALHRFADHDVIGELAAFLLFHGGGHLLKPRPSFAIQGGVQNKDVSGTVHSFAKCPEAIAAV